MFYIIELKFIADNIVVLIIKITKNIHTTALKFEIFTDL